MPIGLWLKQDSIDQYWEIKWGLCYMTLSMHCGIGVYASAPLPMPWMTQRLAGVLIRALNYIRKTSILSKSSQLHCVALDESTEIGRQQRENFTKTQVKINDCTWYLFCFHTCRSQRFRAINSCDPIIQYSFQYQLWDTPVPTNWYWSIS